MKRTSVIDTSALTAGLTVEIVESHEEMKCCERKHPTQNFVF